MKKLILLAAILFCFLAANAQNGQDVTMGDVMRSEGKIYVVVVTMVIVFAGLAIYLFSMDRRLKKIEKENNETKHLL
ncbi:CcmD family protein [Mucilaginibacter glaciei]|uniref:CcmD family protein n=1 Tax=Mucilaginibacter glaciei TaxID=2772109 RepID=A0A926NRL9_9SPHI|nr:CcmD family protein [Mucilaginibacter glaciei]MBD1394756.1 CcmD family protein [Mucilaginibacter glaciei]